MKRYGKLFDSGHWLDAQWWYPEADFLQLGESYDAQGIAYNALAADRGRISLSLDLARADRDKWFNRARDLEAALRKIEEMPYSRGYQSIEMHEVATKALGSTQETKGESNG